MRDSKGAQQIVNAAGKPPSRPPHKLLDGISFLELSKDLSAEEENLRLHVRNVCETLVAPIAAQVWAGGSFDCRFVQACKAIGPAGLQIKEFGCAGLSNVEALLVVMEIARIDASLATFALVHSGLAMRSIAVAGTKEQQQKWLPKMARWEKIGCFALTEAFNGSDAGGLTTRAKSVEGGFVLNGNKRWIGNATRCDLAVVWARDEDTRRVEGFLVEKGTPGFTATAIEGKCALRGIENADIIFSNCFIPAANKMRPGGFSNNTKRVLESSRALVAAACTGLVIGAYDAALQYSSMRIQFGRPLAHFQLIQERLMRALGFASGCLALSVQLGRRLDKGSSSPALPALVKATASLWAREGTKLCREIMGGNGILLDFSVAKAFADVEALYTYEGTYDINMLIAGREATGFSAFK